ncbi:hypothetical protein CO608_02160 [Lysobacteraceae bacterium NML08-0793]|nr:hypothetical protein CO608_02160 [Xanthomonadaceae bacterium NML08-0793]
MSTTLFQRLLGAEFYHLGEEVRHLHGFIAPPHWQGQCTVQRGEGRLARWLCALAKMPPSMCDAPLQVRFQRSPEKEIWQRSFADHPLSSTLKARQGRLQERIGPLSLRLRLYRIDAVLHWIGEGARLFGVLPLPAGWFEEIRCREYGEAGRYHFEVEVNLPLIGRLIHYQGWLEPVG